MAFSRERTPNREKSQEWEKRSVPVQLKERFFSQTPDRLSQYVKEHEDEDEAEELDEAELSEREESNEYDFAPAVYADGSLEPRQSSGLNLRKIYALSIVGGESAQPRCFFAEPVWLRSGRAAAAEVSAGIGGDAEIYFRKLVQFLKQTALWFENEKSEFLTDPSPENFVIGEEASNLNCILHQEKFIAIINKEFPKKSQLDKSQFSRLLDKIWLLGRSWSMPMKAIFSDKYNLDFRKAWVVAVCREAFRNADRDFLEQVPDKKSKRDLALLKRQKALNPHNLFNVCCNEVKISNEDRRVEIFTLIKQEIGENTGD